MKKNNSYLLSAPYIIFMVIFTLIPLGVVGFYALTDPDTGAFSLRNIRELGMYMPVLWQSIPGHVAWQMPLPISWISGKISRAMAICSDTGISNMTIYD